MLCQKFHGFLYHKSTPSNSSEFNFSNLLFSGTFLRIVINKTPKKYKIVEMRMAANEFESFLLIYVRTGIVITGPIKIKKKIGFNITKFINFIAR